MWIVKVALNRPYTFVVLALLILIMSPLVILRTPTDIFPNINIPVIAVGYTFTGLNPEEVEGRLTTPFERSLTALVDNIQHIESTSYNGQAIIKIFLQPGTSLDTANAQVTAAAQATLRQLPPGTEPPLVLDFSASSVPILQLGLSGQGYSATARVAGQRQQGCPVAACAEDGVTDASRQELCRAARQIDGAVVTSCYLVSRLLSLTARCF